MKTEGRASMSAFAVYSNQKKKAKPAKLPRNKKSAKKRKLAEEAVQQPTPSTSFEKSDEEASNQSEENDLPADEAETYAQESPPSEESVSEEERKLPCGNIVALRCFQWMIAPMKVEKFFEDFWEKRYAYIPRTEKNYWSDLFSCRAFDLILKRNRVEYVKDLDIAEYVDGQRRDHNLEGRAYANAVWQAYQEGYTVRLKNPHSYNKKVWQLLSYLQEYFTSVMGCNMYLTPPESQGFSPHYDDIEAFILQIEGTKHWKLYAPRKANEELPRISSPNFSQDEIGTPIFEVDLKAGDMLYFPRGIIHQAKNVGEGPSLHLTISTYQKNTWGDLLQVMLPRAIENAMESDVEFRDSLPKDYLDHVGCVNEDLDSPERGRFFKKLKQLCKKLASHLPVDEVADFHARDFVHGCQPPSYSDREKQCSVHGNSFSWRQKGVVMTEDLQLDTRVRLIRKRAFRFVCGEDEGGARLYHTLENDHDREPEARFVDVGPELVPTFRFLLRSYPDFVRIDNLPLPQADKLLFASDLYNQGFLMTEEPLPRFLSR